MNDENKYHDRSFKCIISQHISLEDALKSKIINGRIPLKLLACKKYNSHKFPIIFKNYLIKNKNKINLEAKYKYDKTALHLVCAFSATYCYMPTPIAKILIDLGANVNCLDNINAHPLILAVKYINADINIKTIELH